MQTIIYGLPLTVIMYHCANSAQRKKREEKKEVIDLAELRQQW